MSIQQVQTKNILELIAQSFLVNGVNPQSNQLYRHLSDYFAKNPAGLPVSLNTELFRNEQLASVDALNEFMATMVVNMDTLYEVCMDHIDQMMMLNTVLRTHLDRLKIKRKVLEQKIDDYLLANYNSDGYFYSFSDSFADTTFTDFQFSSVFLDTLSTTISIPSVSSLSQTVNPNKLSTPSVVVTDSAGATLRYNVKNSFPNAIDGMTNTAWFFEVRTTTPGPVTATIDIQLSTVLGDNSVTKIDLTPYGVTPIQCGINGVFRPDGADPYTIPFCHYVKKSADKMVFVGDQIDKSLDRVIIQATKSEPDYKENTGTVLSNVYIFGFKEILMTEQYYDASAVFVSQPFGIPDELKAEAVIDKVSIVTDDYVPTNTALRYYIAADVAGATSISDFTWRDISPIAAGNLSTAVVNFEGSYGSSKYIRAVPRTSSDLQLINLNSTSPDLSKRNPTAAYVPGVDVYRISAFADDFLAGSIKLEEGINTTRIFYTELSTDAMTKDFTFWKAKFDDSTSYLTSYGEIDSGHEFFYGADVGEDGKSVYVETFLETDNEFPVFLKECRKSDVNSRTWHIRIFLNGREIANMPVGVDKLTVPWKLKEGINHIVVMANIPDSSVANPSPYIGTFNMMGDSKLTDYGQVKLDNWAYVDLYKFQNNQVNEPNSFTIYNGELISRKKPTNNFRLTFKKPTSTAPTAIRLRADFSRSSQYAKATPILDSYRIRFAYS